MKKRRRLQAVLLAGLLALSALGLSACGSEAKKDEASSEETEDSSEKAAGKASAKGAGADKKDDSAESAVPTDITVTLNETNSWSDGSGNNVQYDITVENGGNTEISDWSLDIEVPDGTSIAQSWNMTPTLSGAKLSIVPADYAKTIAPGQASQGLGLIAVTAGGWQNYSISYTEGGEKLTAKGVSGSAAVIGDGAVLSAKADGQAESTDASGTAGGNAGSAPASPASGIASSGKAGTSSKKDTSAGSSASSSNGGSSVNVTAAKGISALSVKGAHLVNSKGQQVRLFGPSTHGIAWFPQYINKAAFQTFRDDWGANCVRLAMYTAESGGYCAGGDKANLKKLIDNGVSYASALGMYVIIDWHILSDGNPQTHQDEAIAFFDEMSKKYASCPNVLYEICNEPNGGVSWSGNIKPYAEAVIPVIRKNAPDSVIIVGTPTWSQDVDKAAADPLKFSNVMYAFHFYAGTHKDDLRNKVDKAVAGGLPVFITECSITDASGNGACDKTSAEAWKALIEKDGLSVMEWSLSNKAESSAILKSSCKKTSGFTEGDLNESGAWYRVMMRSFAGK